MKKNCQTIMATLKLSLLCGAYVFITLPALAQGDATFPGPDSFPQEQSAAPLNDDSLSVVGGVTTPQPSFEDVVPNQNIDLQGQEVMPETVQAEDVVEPPAFDMQDIDPFPMAEEAVQPLLPAELPAQKEQAQSETQAPLTGQQADEDQAAVASNATPADAPSQARGSGRFYDANELLPRSELARGGPRNMDPAKDPASRMVIVETKGTQTEHAANAVAADRALMLGLYDSAAGLYRALYDKNPRDPQVLMGYAIALQKAGRIDNAIEIYKMLLDIQPENVEAEVNMLGLLAEDHPRVALNRLLSLETRHGENTALLAQLAVTHARLRNYDVALQYYGMVSAQQPENANHVYNMAIIADHKGDRDQAKRLYEQALEVDVMHHGAMSLPRDTIFERLAMIR